MTIRDDFKKSLENGSQWIPLEEFKPLRIYAITWSPDRQPQDMETRSLTTFHAQCFHILKAICSDNVCFYMFPEFGTKGNRLHYHGLIAFRTGMSYLRFKHALKGDHVVMKKIHDPSIWYAYMVKQWSHLGSTFFLPFGSAQMLQDFYDTYVFRSLHDLSPLPPSKDEDDGERYINPMRLTPFQRYKGALELMEA